MFSDGSFANYLQDGGRCLFVKDTARHGCGGLRLLNDFIQAVSYWIGNVEFVFRCP